jgi:hypothetical protein
MKAWGAWQRASRNTDTNRDCSFSVMRFLPELHSKLRQGAGGVADGVPSLMREPSTFDKQVRATFTYLPH